MKREFILLLLFLSLFLFVPTSYSQELSDWEFGVYYDFIEKYLNMPDWAKENEDRIYKEVTNKYSITSDKLGDILDRGYERRPTEWEWKVGEELFDKMSNLSKGATEEDTNRVFREIAKKYGISHDYLNDITYRTMWDLMMWDF